MSSKFKYAKHDKTRIRKEKTDFFPLSENRLLLNISLNSEKVFLILYKV